MVRHASWLCIAALAIVFGLHVAGCDSRGSERQGTAAGSAGATATKARTLAFVTNNASDFWTIARAGCQKAATETGIKLEFKIPEDGTAATQKRIVDDLLAKGVDGIAISPVDPANMTSMLNDAAKQTLLFTHDSDAPKSDRACYVGTDNVAAGRQAGDLIKAALGDRGGKIVLFVGTLDAQNARERYTGVKEALAGSKVEVVDIRTDDADRVRAKSNVLDTLVKYPDVACLVGLWSYNGPAIVNAVREAGKAGAVKIVCFDEEDETLAGVREGTIYATVVQQPYEFGYRALTLMSRALGGDKSTIPAGKQVIVPTLAIQRDGVDAFASKLKSLRGR